MVHGSLSDLAMAEVEACPGVLMHLNKKRAIGSDDTQQYHISAIPYQIKNQTLGCTISDTNKLLACNS